MQSNDFRMRPRFRVRNIPLWFAGAFVLLFGFSLVRFSSSDADARTGTRYYQQGDYVRAEGWLRRSTRTNPQNGQAAYYLGLCLLRDGRRAEALAQFQVARAVGLGIPKFRERDEELVQEAQAQIDRLQ